MPVVTKRATAKRDLIEHFVYLAENASVDVADRFLANARGIHHGQARIELNKYETFGNDSGAARKSPP